MKKIGLFLIILFASSSASMNYAMQETKVLRSKQLKQSSAYPREVMSYKRGSSYIDNPNFFMTPYEETGKFDAIMVTLIKVACRLSTCMNHFSNAFSGEQVFIKSKGRPEDKKRRLRCCRYMKRFSTGKRGMVKANL